MGARDDILSAIRARRTGALAHPPRYRAPDRGADAVTRFAERAQSEQAEVRVLETLGDVAEAVSDILRSRNMPAAIHLPPDPKMETLAWNPSLERKRTPPGPNDAAISFAPFAIAETGTLVYTAAPHTPASWHFRPGLEIAVVAAADILPTLEAVLARIGPMASTVNLVTGPSRTGDIEQTLELGAHGPKALSILIVKA
jgi:L-lactate dehydrogenase complex protein LldG